MRAVELFAGAGGLGIGTGRAGFKHEVVVEWDHDACETVRHNQRRQVPDVQGWSVFEGDVRAFDFGTVAPGVTLVSGGPPCQPFSLGGKHRAFKDSRDMFPMAAEVVRQLRPEVFIFENVKGLLREAFSTYFGYVILRLTYPEMVRKDREEWQDHLARLERHHTGPRHDDGLHYRVVHQLLNAADFGVPQSRERVFIVGFRSDLQMEWSFPRATHSAEALLHSQWVTGEYWDQHKISKKRRPQQPTRYAGRITRLKSTEPACLQSRWLTVRDAICDLPDPEREPLLAQGVLNHRFNPGARSYPGHTGSPWDWPAKTLKAGDHGVPGGENMLAREDGTVRYFTVRESARLQTFPDNYEFQGSWSEAMRQLGNAVPVKLAQAVADSVRSHLEDRKAGGRGEA